MSRVTYLNEKDFFLSKGNKNVLCTTRKGISVVMFSSRKCKHCEETYPIFSKLSIIDYKVPCSFGVLLAEDNIQVILSSRTSTSPIEATPYIIIYVNGRPSMAYTGNRDLKSMSAFIYEFVTRIGGPMVNSSPQTKVKITMEDVSKLKQFGGIPYNIECDKEKCYLVFSELGKKSS
jgi:hypothetical protein